MEIRKLTRNDFLRARVLLNNVLGGLENPNFLQCVKDENLENMLLSGTMFGAFKKGELVGISALELDECPYEIRYKSESERLFIGEIMFMAVKIENRGKGIINKINNVLIEQAKNLGARMLCFCVHPENMAAIKAVSKLGKLEFLGFVDKNIDAPGVVYGVKI